MKLIKSIVRPNKVDEVKAALEKLQISGMTVTEVRGHGKQKGHTAIYRGQEYNVSLLPKMEIEVVVPDSMADDAIKAIIEAARTGEIGDGRVFVLPVAESYKIRTGEKEVVSRDSCRRRSERLRSEGGGQGVDGDFRSLMMKTFSPGRIKPSSRRASSSIAVGSFRRRRASSRSRAFSARCRAMRGRQLVVLPPRAAACASSPRSPTSASTITTIASKQTRAADRRA